MGRRAFSTHNIEDCLFIKQEPNSQGKARMIDCVDSRTEEDDLADQYEEYYEECEVHNAKRITDHVINKIANDVSPVLSVHHNDEEVDVTLDSGATCNVIGQKEPLKHKCKIRPTSQTACMADGKSSLEIVG
jgi:hypothetical protein